MNSSWIAIKTHIDFYEKNGKVAEWNTSISTFSFILIPVVIECTSVNAKLEILEMQVHFYVTMQKY